MSFDGPQRKTNHDQLEDDLGSLSSLSEPTRRDIYDFVASASDPVSRDEVAEGVGVSRPVAAYHLDRLADDGLLDYEFRRLTGREGPGAGRPSKLYRRSDRVIDVSVPARRYQLAAQILLEAMQVGQIDNTTLDAVARRVGVRLGEDGLKKALDDTGYEAVPEEGEIRFRNCPFHALRDQDRETTCGLNLALVEGMVEGDRSDVTAVLAPEEGYCCVRLQPAG